MVPVGFVSLSYVWGAAYLHGMSKSPALVMPREDSIFDYCGNWEGQNATKTRWMYRLRLE